MIFLPATPATFSAGSQLSQRLSGVGVIEPERIVISVVYPGATPEELVQVARERKRFFSFAQGASYLMARRVLAPLADRYSHLAAAVSDEPRAFDLRLEAVTAE